MSIYLIGDVHGDFEKILYFKHIIENNKLIVLGDFGLVWNNQSNTSLDILEAFNTEIYFLDGNHENFDMLEQYPIIEKHGGKVSVIRKNIFWLRRGEIYNIDNNKILTVGGAFSIDKCYRVEYISWWKQEEINFEEIQNTLSNLNKHNNQVDYILTHTCPNTLREKMFEFTTKKSDSNTDFFDYLVDDKIINFKKWYFGHFHEDISYENFSCLHNNIKLLGE